MKRYNPNEIAQLDLSLYQLAIYEATGGMIVIPKSTDEAMGLQQKIAEIFNRFKRDIQDGECTYDFIEQVVLHKNGAVLNQMKVGDELPTDEQIHAMIEEGKKEETLTSFESLLKDMFGNLMSKGKFTEEIKKENDKPNESNVQIPPKIKPTKKPPAKKNTKKKNA